MKTLIGQAARKEDYFPREAITDDIWEKLYSGSNLLFVAPRRVGKSSILFNLFDDPKEKHIVIYYTSESVNSVNEFFKKLFYLVVERINKVEKFKAVFASLTKGVLHSIESVGKEGIKFRHESEISFYDELLSLIRKMDFEDQKILVLVDEFAQTVENIIVDSDEKTAIHFLEMNRVIRQTPEIHKKLQFVYAGSIGLENVVSRLNVTNLINDLTAIKILALNALEVKELITKIIDDNDISFETGAYDYLLEKVEWWIPFYFQLILDEVDKLLSVEKLTQITNSIIDRAIQNAISIRNYFEFWYTRLRAAYKAEQFSFMKELLNIISEKQLIRSFEIIDLATRYHLEDSYLESIKVLKHDGYINNNDDPKMYRFNSPLLRIWWNYNVAN